MKKMSRHAYALSIDQVAALFSVNPEQGLSSQEADLRVARVGLNEVPEKKADSWLVIFVRLFRSPLIYILLVAAAFLFIVGPDRLDAFLVSGILLFNALIGTVQEGRAQYILESLRQFIMVDCVVLRDGQKKVIRDRFLVPGDIVFLHEGQRVPADLRLVWAQQVLVDEALLTGESGAVQKQLEPVSIDAVLADRSNMVFKGTHVMSGNAQGIVVATGDRTEIGSLHREASGIQQEMPLKKELDRLSHWILIFILAVCLGLFVAGLVLGKPLRELFVMLTALFVCVIPEGLPLVLTLVLVTGMHRMVKRMVLVKKMQAVEALGRTDVIVIDKTGTLTRNEMMVTAVVAHDQWFEVTGSGYESAGTLHAQGAPVHDLAALARVRQCALAAALTSRADVAKDAQTGLFTVKGDPTEAALLIWARKLKQDDSQLKKMFQERYVFMFDPRLKYRAAFYQEGTQLHLFVLGAPETIMGWSVVSEKEKALLADLLERGLRVVGVAHASMPVPEWAGQNDSVEQYHALFDACVARKLAFDAFCGIQDAIREDVGQVIEQVRAAGLRVIMATGDHQKTALYVARQVGIFRAGDQAIDGAELSHLSDHELAERSDAVTVYSRVSPTHKLRIIRMLHVHGNIVAMTGDGVNDVPSLLAADVGIAMGGIGTEFAKEVADMVLLNDSFVSIVDAIEQGRHILRTLRRVVLYFFATNMGEVLVVLFALVVAFFHDGFPLPLHAVHILWLNLVTDGFLDTAISMEQQEEGLLADKQLHQKLRLVDPQMLLKSFLMALPMGIGALLIFGYYHEADLVYARSMALTTMAVFQWFNAWNCRSEKYSIFKLGLLSNRWLLGATALVVSLQVMLLNVPFMQRIFKTTTLSLGDWLLILVVSSSILLIEEVRKRVQR